MGCAGRGRGWWGKGGAGQPWQQRGRRLVGVGALAVGPGRRAGARARPWIVEDKGSAKRLLACSFIRCCLAQRLGELTVWRGGMRTATCCAALFSSSSSKGGRSSSRGRGGGGVTGNTGEQEDQGDGGKLRVHEHGQDQGRRGSRRRTVCRAAVRGAKLCRMTNRVLSRTMGQGRGRSTPSGRTAARGKGRARCSVRSSTLLAGRPTQCNLLAAAAGPARVAGAEIAGACRGWTPVRRCRSRSGAVDLRSS